MRVLLIILPTLLIVSCLRNKTEACGKKDVLKQLDWLADQKEDFEDGEGDANQTIVHYTYEGEDVFEINSCGGCADNLIVIKDCSGTTICEFGGIAGLNTCPDFYDEAKTGDLLYHE